MKKILFIFIASLGALTDVVHADQVITQLAPPFQTLNLDTKVWSLTKENSELVRFIGNIEGASCRFEIAQGPSRGISSLCELKKQIHDANGNLTRVLMLQLGHSLSTAKKQEDDMGKTIFKDWGEVKVNGIDGIAGEVEWIPGENYYSRPIPGRHLRYYFVTGNKHTRIVFSATSEKFLELKPLFEQTVQNLFIKTFKE